MTKLTDKQTKKEFLKKAGVTDHPYSRTPKECCGESPASHLGYGNIPWTLPSIAEMRELLKK